MRRCWPAWSQSRPASAFVPSASRHAIWFDSLGTRGYAAARIGADFASYGFTAATHRRLTGLLPEATFVDLEGISDTLGDIKSLAEIALLERTGSITDRAMEELRVVAAPGILPRDLAAIA